MATVLDHPRVPPAPPAQETKSRRRRPLYIAIAAAVVAIVAIVVAFTASGSGSSALPAGVTPLKVTQADQGIELSKATVGAGRIGFEITNQGTMGHELVVFRTDLPADKLPMNKDGNVDEQSPLLHSVLDTGGDIAQGHSRTIIVNLPAGHYVVICNLPAHYRLGMHADLTVR